MTKLYRVDNPTTSVGLWYHNLTGHRTETVEKFDLSMRQMPMPFHERIALGAWRSATRDLAELKFWFTKDDLIKIVPLGYNLYEIETDFVADIETADYRHAIFRDADVISRQILDIRALHG